MPNRTSDRMSDYMSITQLGAIVGIIIRKGQHPSQNLILTEVMAITRPFGSRNPAATPTTQTTPRPRPGRGRGGVNPTPTDPVEKPKRRTKEIQRFSQALLYSRPFLSVEHSIRNSRTFHMISWTNESVLLIHDVTITL